MSELKRVIWYCYSHVLHYQNCHRPTNDPVGLPLWHGHAHHPLLHSFTSHFVFQTLWPSDLSKNHGNKAIGNLLSPFILHCVRRLRLPLPDHASRPIYTTVIANLSDSSLKRQKKREKTFGKHYDLWRIKKQKKKRTG